MNLSLPVTAFLVISLAVAAPAEAQSRLRGCRAGSEGKNVGIALVIPSTSIVPPSDGDVFHQFRSNAGFGLSGHFGRSAGEAWGARVEYDHSWYGVDRRELDGTGRISAGTISDRRFGFAALKNTAGNADGTACLMWILGANVHRFRYGDAGSTAIGATVGAEFTFQLAERRRLFTGFTLDFADAINNAFGSSMFVGRLILGWELRFR